MLLADFLDVDVVPIASVSPIRIFIFGIKMWIISYVVEYVLLINKLLFYIS